MLRARIYLALPIVGITVACFHSSADSNQAAAPPSPDTVTVARAFQSVTVERTDDSVTIVLIAERGMGVNKVHAAYGSGPTYLLWIKRGNVAVTHVPWHPGGLQFNGSLPLPAEPGDVLVLRYPEDLLRGGLLRRP
jgi:hypothetical protein